MRRVFVMSTTLIVAGLFVIIVALGQERPPVTQPAPDRTPLGDQITMEERIDKTVSLRTKDGRTTPIHVVVRNWGIRGGQPVSEFPEQGLMIVQLRAGKVVTVIDGQRQERNEDEFWTVPAGSRMSVEVTGETAVIQTMSIK